MSKQNVSFQMFQFHISIHICCQCAILFHFISLSLVFPEFVYSLWNYSVSIPAFHFHTLPVNSSFLFNIMCVIRFSWINQDLIWSVLIPTSIFIYWKSWCHSHSYITSFPYQSLFIPNQVLQFHFNLSHSTLKSIRSVDSSFRCHCISVGQCGSNLICLF